MYRKKERLRRVNEVPSCFASLLYYSFSCRRVYSLLPGDHLYINTGRHFYNKPAPNVTKQPNIQSFSYGLFLLFYKRALHAAPFPRISLCIRL